MEAADRILMEADAKGSKLEAGLSGMSSDPQLARQSAETPLHTRTVVSLLIIAALVSLYVQPLTMYVTLDDALMCTYFDQTKHTVDWSVVGRGYWSEIPIFVGCKHYRPFFGSLYAVCYTFFGQSFGLWHLLYVLVHFAVAAAFLLLARQIFGLHKYSCVRTMALVAGAGFLFAPLNAYTYSWFGTVADVAQTLFAVLAIVMYGYSIQELWRGRAAVSVVWFAGTIVAMVLAFASKETSLVLGPALFVHALFMLAGSGAWRRLSVSIAALSMLIPFAIVQGMFLLFRRAILGVALGFYGSSPTFNLTDMRNRISGFLSQWYGCCNQFVFMGISSYITFLAKVLLILIVALAIVRLLLDSRRWHRLLCVAHCLVLACIALVPAAAVRLFVSPGGWCYDGYYASGFLCMAIVGGLWNARSEGPEQHKWLALLRGGARRGAALLICFTLVFWFILHQGTLHAIRKTNNLCRDLVNASGRLKRQSGRHPCSIVNQPPFCLRIPCLFLLDIERSFHKFPLDDTDQPPGIATPYVFHLDVKGRNRVSNRDDLLRNARRIVSTTDGTLAIRGQNAFEITVAPTKSFAKRPNHVFYARFHTESDEWYNTSNAELKWKTKGHDPNEFTMMYQSFVVAKQERDRCEVFFVIGAEPGYLCESKPISKFFFKWSGYGYPGKKPIDLSLVEAAVLECPDSGV